MAHRNVAAAGLIHNRARGRVLTTALAVALFSLSFFFLLPLYYGVAVQVTSITALNARRVPTSTSFCSRHDRCEIYLDSNIAAEMSTHCRAQLLRFRSISTNLQKRSHVQSAVVASERSTNIISSKIFELLMCAITDDQIK